MNFGYYPAAPPVTRQDIRHESLGKALAGSVITHGIVIGLVAASGLWSLRSNTFGSPNASTGSVGVNMVKTIPIPRREAPVNPLANDTNSNIPQTPPALKPQRVAKAEPENAIAIPDKNVKRQRLTPKQEMEALFRPPVQYKSNQVFANTPQAASSPLYGIQGAGGIDVGPASVLGSRFGAYVNLMRDRIAQHWNTASVHSSPSQRCQITFTIARNGTVSNVQVLQPSGDYLLDTSAKRAVLDANPLPALPPQFDRDSATVELWFQLRP